MIIASDNHAYRRLTPFAPVIRGHKCLFGVFPPLPHPNWARSVAPASRAGRLKPLFPARLAGAAARTHPVRPPPKGAGSLQVGANDKCPADYNPQQISLMLGSPKAGAMADGAANAPASPPPTPKGVEIINKKRCPRALLRRDPWRLHRPRLNKALGIICRLAEFNPLRPRNSGAQMLNLLACPPLPHPNWARSVAPASLGGRRKRRFFRPVWQGLPPAPIPCALPPRGRAPYRLAQTTNALPIITPSKSPSCSGVPRQEQWRTVPPMPLPARPPPLKGWRLLIKSGVREPC